MRYGVSTVSDLAMVSVDSLVRLIGAASGRSLHELAWGRDRRPVIAERAARSIGHEETFEYDIHDAATMARRAREMAALVATRCRRAGVEGRTVTVKVRFSDFSSLSRSRTLDRAASTASAIGDAAVALLSSIPPGKGVRLVGVYCSSFGRGTSDVAARQVASDGEPKGATQLRLFSDTGQSDSIEAAAEAIRERFGTSAIAVFASRQSGGLNGPAGPNRAR
jgi:DNA polymerase-4